MAAYPSEVSALIEALVDGIPEALRDNVVGIYLRGSLALGDFDADTSDVDVLVVTERRVSETEFGALRELHDRIDARENAFGRHYEVSYMDQNRSKACVRCAHPSTRGVPPDPPFCGSSVSCRPIRGSWGVRRPWCGPTPN